MAYVFPRCQVVPLPGHQVAFEIDGAERSRWHFGREYPRPFLYPLLGPSGSSLTRMGHPGAANHDHHRSVWFAHAKVLGIDFWSDQTPASIRQLEWLAYVDGAEGALMAVTLGWFDGHDPEPLLKQELVLAVRPREPRETLIELQATFVPQAEMFEFQQTNFGFLAVRVARHISAYFGGGQLTDAEGRVGEKAIFGQTAAWMDYSGPAPKNPFVAEEGLTYFNHPTNPRHPVAWHVREDGWMGASVCMHDSLLTTRERPLRLRYMLHAHGGLVDLELARAVAEEFAASPPFRVSKATVPHTMYVVER